jgi:hypothetical protein
MFLQSARPAFFHLTVVKYKQKWDAHDAEFGGQHWAGIDVEFSDPDFTF